MSTTPFVIGQWVRGERFYGRAALIDEILSGPRNWLWLLGTRRIGKTSLLKQVELLTTSAPERGYFPLFWDFQGADNPDELHAGFNDALLDAEERFDQQGIALRDVEGQDLFESLGRLRRRLRAKGLKPLLLCDEVEELIKLNQRDPSLLRKLRRVMQSQEDVRTVMASTIRLWALSDERGDTSPFLHGFAPPLYIHNLSDDEARALISQVNLPSDSRPRILEKEAEQIRTHCDNHPYLVQLLCKRYLELGSFEEALDQVAADPMVGFFFSVDFEMLTEAEHDIIRIIAEQDSSTSNSIQQHLVLDTSQLAGSLHRLEHLGYIRKNASRRFVLANFFFRRWFHELPAGRAARPATPAAALNGPDSVVQTSRTTPDLESAFDGRYDLLERIGRGATGIVYKAHDRMLNATMAIKLLKPEYAANEDALERLRREIVLGRDISHPSVVRIYHLGDCDGRKYITMQWVDGPTLAQIISREAPLDAQRVVAIGMKLAGALEAAHACHVLHRDLKPQNILVDRNGEPRLSDFGLARLMNDPGTTQHGMFVGTPDYASPEQAGARALDERSDLYSLAVVLFEMATGRRPFLAASAHEILQMHRETPPPSPRTLRRDLPPRLSELIMRGLEKDPSRRFQTARELRAGLEALGAR